MNKITCDLSVHSPEQGDIYEVDGDLYILARCVDKFLLIGLRNGNCFDHPNNIDKAVEEATFVGRNIEITVTNKPLTK